MIRNCLKLFVFLFFLNSVSQNIETIELERDQEISSFINDYEISPSDFFILNTDYTENRFNHTSSDLTQKLIKGDLLRVFEKSGINQNTQTSFITHKVKRKQSLSEIALIYGISENLILEYNKGVTIKKNNTLQIPTITEMSLWKPRCS